MRILYAGPLAPGETCEMRRLALERLGHRTIGVDYMAVARELSTLSRKVQWRLRFGPLIRRYNARLLAALDRERPDALWVDKGIFVLPAVLQEARRRGTRRLVHYSPDNYFLRQNSSRFLRAQLPLYDLVVTTKRHNVQRLRERGARRVLLSGNAFDPLVHRPSPTLEETCEVSFIGRFEPDRERLLDDLLGSGIAVSIRGIGWERARATRVQRAFDATPAFGPAYAHAISAAKINLGLLSRLAEDEITQRSIEIPACGAFLLAERTAEHEAHFEDGREAAFFDDLEDLRSKVRHYLGAAEERRRIAAAGRERCLRSGYSYDDRLREIAEALDD